MFFNIVLLKNFAIFTGKQLCWSLFLIKLQAFRLATLLKRDSNTGVFLCILRSFIYVEKYLQTAAPDYCLKRHVKIVEKYRVKFNVPVLNRLKIMEFLEMQSIYVNIMSFEIKFSPKFSLFWQNIFFSISEPYKLPYRKTVLFAVVHYLFRWCTNFEMWGCWLRSYWWSFQLFLDQSELKCWKSGCGS